MTSAYAEGDGCNCRDRTESGNHGMKYKEFLNYMNEFEGATLSDRVYDYVVTSQNGLRINASLVENFRRTMVQ